MEPCQWVIDARSFEVASWSRLDIDPFEDENPTVSERPATSHRGLQYLVPEERTAQLHRCVIPPTFEWVSHEPIGIAIQNRLPSLHISSTNSKNPDELQVHTRAVVRSVQMCRPRANDRVASDLTH